MGKNQINVWIIEPDGFPYKANLDNSLEALQGIVGGYIETVEINSETILICNEEGKLSDLDPNFAMGDDMIVGPVIICGCDGEEFTDCPFYWNDILDFTDLQGIAKTEGMSEDKLIKRIHKVHLSNEINSAAGL